MHSRERIRGFIRARVQQTTLGRMFWNHFPWRTRFADDVARQVPFGVDQMSRLWLREYPNLALESTRVFDAYQGGDFMDIGAFHGWYSLLLGPKAGTGGSFVSIEPDTQALPTLMHSLTVARELFPQLSLSLVDKPMGDGGRAERTQMGGGHPAYLPVESATTGAPTLTADELVDALRLEPSFIKIDVEGAEHSVLKGMRATLETFRPTLMIEIHPEWLPTSVIVENIYSLLKSHCYAADPIDERHILFFNAYR